MKCDIVYILSSYYSPEHYTITGTDYNTLIWHDKSITPPSLKFLQDKADKLNNLKPIDLLREERNKLLNSTDKYLTSDFVYPIGTTKEDWITYRQALRDLPTTATPQLNDDFELTNVTWPTPPS